MREHGMTPARDLQSPGSDGPGDEAFGRMLGELAQLRDQDAALNARSN